MLKAAPVRSQQHDGGLPHQFGSPGRSVPALGWDRYDLAGGTDPRTASSEWIINFNTTLRALFNLPAPEAISGAAAVPPFSPDRNGSSGRPLHHLRTMADQNPTPPITSAPKRSSDHPSTISSLGMFSGVAPSPLPHLHGSESCKNSPNVPRRHDHHLPHHAAALLLLESGSQSAQSSPLPNRRLDKLQGVIRDGQRSTPLVGRRGTDGGGGEYELDRMTIDSPLISRRFLQQQQSCECMGATPAKRRAASECACSDPQQLSQQQAMRKRVDSDCSGACLRKNVVRHNFGLASVAGGGVSSCESSPLPVRRKELPGQHAGAFPVSPAKSVLGEPGVFSSPIHRPGGSGMQPYAHHHAVTSFLATASPAKSVLGEPGVFSSPARSVICSPPGGSGGSGGGGGGGGVSGSVVCAGEVLDETDACGGGVSVSGAANDALANDQTIVSGWLKFRDSKKASTGEAVKALSFGVIRNALEHSDHDLLQKTSHHQ
uniref:Uncharacterized protein n=1 Tax=Anopheles atroparvus TaxID=41427 RepID=A0A182IVE4_ANOAO